MTIAFAEQGSETQFMWRTRFATAAQCARADLRRRPKQRNFDRVAAELRAMVLAKQPPLAQRMAERDRH